MRGASEYFLSALTMAERDRKYRQQSGCPERRPSSEVPALYARCARGTAKIR
jgi:hypothetical protein